MDSLNHPLEQVPQVPQVLAAQAAFVQTDAVRWPWSYCPFDQSGGAVGGNSVLGAGGGRGAQRRKESAEGSQIWPLHQGLQGINESQEEAGG